jgi:hypothetical protein
VVAGEDEDFAGWFSWVGHGCLVAEGLGEDCEDGMGDVNSDDLGGRTVIIETNDWANFLSMSSDSNCHEICYNRSQTFARGSLCTCLSSASLTIY